MQAKKRYLLVTSCGILLVLGYFTLLRESSSQSHHAPHSIQTGENAASRSGEFRVFLDWGEHDFSVDLHVSPRNRRQAETPVHDDYRKCRMENCFDFSLCQNAAGFKVYVYPDQQPLSQNYRKILTSIRESRYYTDNPDEACIFVLTVDTVDRDVLSQDYLKDVPTKVNELSLWKKMNGRNHVVFNLYSGTWPEYIEEDLGFNFGQAMLAKASISIANFRPNFDISIPLFGKDHPQKGGENYERTNSNIIPPYATRQYLLAFKGKRYLNGIGSETRNALYHIHNGKDIILLTTCKHGKSWKAMQDGRCESDNKEYDRFDYKKLLYNSTFCLVPRGRRLGSFRFLESLQAACVPVLASNHWELPFSEVIDWNKAVIWADERLILQVPSIVRSIPKSKIVSQRQQAQFLWDAYFSSVDKIVTTTLEILRDRIFKHVAHTQNLWSMVPGAPYILTDYASTLESFPFYLRPRGKAPGHQFTAVIYAVSPVMFSSSPLFRLIRSVAKSAYVHKIIVLWHCEVSPPSQQKWPTDLNVPVIVKSKDVKTISSRFFPHEEIQTDAILSLDEDALLNTDEVDFAFVVWREFPDRIVGYPARSHYWDEAKDRWSYSSKWTNEYSMVLTGAAFYHRYYNSLYSRLLNSVLRKTVDQSQNCEDILMNFLVSHVTKLPPIKVTQRKSFKEAMLPGNSRPSSWLDADHFSQRQVCVNTFATIFGYMPLVRTSMRLDPMLFKDPVSIVRKHYRKIEEVNIT